MIVLRFGEAAIGAAIGRRGARSRVCQELLEEENRGFIRNALGSCLDYDSPSFSVADVGAEEFNFGFEDGLEEPAPYARDLLAGAQSWHGIFNEEFVVKAFYEAEKAYRGQMRVGGDPYLQHCVETAVLLARIGANTTVVVAGLLHDTLDDLFMNYDYIFQTFGAGVADLVEGVPSVWSLPDSRQVPSSCGKP